MMSVVFPGKLSIRSALRTGCSGGAKFAAVSCLLLFSKAGTAASIHGQVVDLNGRPVPQAQILFDRDEEAAGASVVTVFSDGEGRFGFPGDYPDASQGTLDISVRALGYEEIGQVVDADSANALQVTFVVGTVENQVAVAPASAWLGRITDRAQQSKLIVDCIVCHQVPDPEVRAYAGLIDDLHAPDPVLARSQSWSAMVKYMNYLSSWEFSRGERDEEERIDANAVYSVDNGADVAALLTEIFDDRLDRISGYEWGAPQIATRDTAIWEYEVPHPNAIREALMLGDPARLWIADVSSNRMIAADVVTGEQEIHEVPSGVLMSPHTLHPGQDRSLWVAGLFNGVVAHLDTGTERWRTWRMLSDDGRTPGVHDLSFGYEHELLTDSRGRIWFSDILNNTVGFFDPGDGNSRLWGAPPSPGREGVAAMYGLIMTRDRNEIWYSQLRNGTIGGFNIETEEFIGPFQLDDPNAGPRRITIDDNDVMYVALYGRGQLAQFDTRTRQMVGIYDLPDTASAPYSATWDPVRRVVWIPTSNADVIYRFDPETGTFGVLPLPRVQSFLRMLDVDPRTGVLITSYANIVDIVQGPRMAMIIEPGDGVYPEKFTPTMGARAAGGSGR